MKKWSFLVAALLMMSATVTTTSCIDNDEPEGITVLRGAKAELLKAKAALELAKAKTEEQNANLVAAQAAVQQAIAKEHEAQAKINEAEAKKVEAEAALVNAETEIAKAQAQQELAKLDQIIAENALELEKLQAQQEAALIKAKKDAAEAQAALENTLAEIEAAKAVLTDKEATKLAALEKIAADKFDAYVAAQQTVLAKMEALFNAETAKQDENEKYQEMLADAKAETEALKAVLEDLNDLKAATEITEWETKLAELKDFVNEAEVEFTELGVQRAEIKEANRELAHKIAEDLEPAVKDAEKALDKAKNETKYTTSKQEIKIANTWIQGKLGSKLTLAEQKDKTYAEISDKNFVGTTTIKGWEDAVKALKVTAEEAAGVGCGEDLEKKLETAQENHTKATEKWEKMHTIQENQAVEESVSTDAFKAAIEKYNANIDALEAAVKAYNTAYDKAVETITAQNLEAEKISFAETQINTKLGTVGTVNGRKTVDQINALIDSSTLNAQEKSDMKKAVLKAINDRWDEKSAADQKQAERDAVAKDTQIAADETVKAAMAAITSTDPKKPGVMQAILKEEGDAKKLENGKYDNGSYMALSDAVKVFGTAAANNCEKIKKAEDSNAEAIAKYTGVGTKIFVAGQDINATEGDLEVLETSWYLLEAVKGETSYKGNGHLQVVRTKVSEENVAKMVVVEFNSTQAETNWNNASKEAFGVEGRHTAATSMTKVVKDGVTTYVDQEGNVYAEADYTSSNTLAALKAAQDKVDEKEAILAAEEEIAVLATAVADAKKALEAEIAVAQADVDEKDAALTAAKDDLKAANEEWDALFKEVDEAEHALNWTIDLKKDIENNLEKVIAVYYAGLDIDGVKNFEDLMKFIDKQIEGAEKDLKDAEKIITMAQKDLDQLVAKEDFDGVAAASLDLEAAQAKLETAQAQYEFALAQVNAYVEALSK